MSTWQPEQYDPAQHRRHSQGPPLQQPGPQQMPPYGYGQPPRRGRSRVPLFAGLGALAVLAAGGAAYALAGHGSTTAKPLTCRQQYANWKTGPAHDAGQLKADYAAMATAARSEDFKTITSAIEAIGADAAALQAYPLPACADPAGYWKQSLADMQAAGDNAGTASGLGGILLAEAPLKNVRVLGDKLAAELKRTTGS